MSKNKIITLKKPEELSEDPLTELLLLRLNLKLS